MPTNPSMAAAIVGAAESNKIGFIEEGTTTTPFDMVVLNELDRFHLAIEAIDRVPGLVTRAAQALTTVWSLGTSLTLAANESRTVVARMVDGTPFTAAVTPKIGRAHV